MASAEDLSGSIRSCATPEASQPASARSWRDRAAMLTMFRILAGVLLAAHYVRHLEFTAALWGPDGVLRKSDAADASVFAPISNALLHLGANSARAWFALGAGLGLLLAAGFAQRLCAALLVVVGAVTYQALLPVVTLDDWLAQGVGFWLLLLLPSIAQRPSSASRTAQRPNHGTSPALMCLAFMSIFFIEASLESSVLPPSVRWCVFAAAGFAIAPIGRWRALAIVPAAVFVSRLAMTTGSVVGAGLSIVLCGAAIARLSTARPDGAAGGEPFGLAAAVGSMAVFLQALRLLAILLHVTSIVYSTGYVTSAVGLPPYPGFDARGSAISAVGFLADGHDRAEPISAGPTNPTLLQRVRSLDEDSAISARQRANLLAYLARQRCRGAAGVDGRQAGRLVLLSGDGVIRPVAWLQCGARGEDPALVPLESR